MKSQSNGTNWTSKVRIDLAKIVSVKQVEDLLEKYGQLGEVYRTRLKVIKDLLENPNLTYQEIGNMHFLSRSYVREMAGNAAKNGILGIIPEKILKCLDISEAEITKPLEALSDENIKLISEINKIIDNDPNISAKALTKLHVVLLAAHGFDISKLAQAFRKTDGDIKSLVELVKNDGISCCLESKLKSDNAKEPKFVEKPVEKSDEKPVNPEKLLEQAILVEKSLASENPQRKRISSLTNQKGIYASMSSAKSVKRLLQNTDIKYKSDDSDKNHKALNWLESYVPANNRERLVIKKLKELLVDEPILEIAKNSKIPVESAISFREHVWNDGLSHESLKIIANALGIDEDTSETELQETSVSDKEEKEEVPPKGMEILWNRFGIKNTTQHKSMKRELISLLHRFPDNRRLLAINEIFNGKSSRQAASLHGWGESSVRAFCAKIKVGGFKNLMKMEGIEI